MRKEKGMEEKIKKRGNVDKFVEWFYSKKYTYLYIYKFVFFGDKKVV